MQAHLLSLNDFGMPKVLDGSDAMYTKLIYLILLEKGKIQSHPTMGVGIRSRYRMNNSDGFLDNLKEDIASQVQAFLPSLSNIEISLNLNSSTNVLGILINTDTGAYALAYNGNDNTIDAPATYILTDLV